MLAKLVLYGDTVPTYTLATSPRNFGVTVPNFNRLKNSENTLWRVFIFYHNDASSVVVLIDATNSQQKIQCIQYGYIWWNLGNAWIL